MDVLLIIVFISNDIRFQLCSYQLLHLNELIPVLEENEMLNYFVILKGKSGIPPPIICDCHLVLQWLRNENIFLIIKVKRVSLNTHQKIISFVHPQHIEAYFCCLTISHFCNYVNENSREIRLWRLVGRFVFFSSSSPPKRWLLVILWFLIFDCCSFLLFFLVFSFAALFFLSLPFSMSSY